MLLLIEFNIILNSDRASMKETTPAAMPPCFDRWCQKFDDLFLNKAQKRECRMHRAADSGILNPASARFRQYLGGLLGESERKNVSQIAKDTVKVSGRAGASLLPSPLRTERATFKAFGSSNITSSFDGVLYDDRTNEPRLGYLEYLCHLQTEV